MVSPSWTPSSSSLSRIPVSLRKFWKKRNPFSESRFVSFWLKLRPDPFYQVLVSLKDEIGFISCNNLRAFRELFIVLFQFTVNFVNILNGIPALTSGCVYYMNHHLRALNMTEKLMTKAGSKGCSFDQTRNICQDESFSI